MATPPYSYSSIKLFETCPKKYEAEKITKEVKFTDNEHTLYGTAVHKAAEDFVHSHKPIPERFSFLEPMLEKLVKIKGAKFVEWRTGISRNEAGKLEACEFFARDVWWRGVIDLLIIDFDSSTAYVIDYKTNKDTKYADMRQLKLCAAAVFLRYPEIKKVKMGLLFVVCNEFIPAMVEYKNRLDIFSELDELLQRREEAYASGVFNPKPNGLCRKYCEVLSCEHNGRN